VAGPFGNRRIGTLRRSIPWYDAGCAAICEVLAVARRTMQHQGDRIIGF
jgi:hypothetical protein